MWTKISPAFGRFSGWFRHMTNQQNARQIYIFKTSKSSKAYQTSNLKPVCKSARNLSSETGDTAPVTCLAVLWMRFLLRFIRTSVMFLVSMLMFRLRCIRHGKRFSSLPLCFWRAWQFTILSLIILKKLAADWVWLIIVKMSSKLICKLSQNHCENWNPCKTAKNDMWHMCHAISYQGPLGCQERLHHFVASSWKRADFSRPVRPSTKCSCDTARLWTWTRIFPLRAYLWKDKLVTAIFRALKQMIQNFTAWNRGVARGVSSGANDPERKVSFIFQKKSYQNNLIPIIFILSLSVEPLSKNPGDAYVKHSLILTKSMRIKFLLLRSL